MSANGAIEDTTQVDANNIPKVDAVKAGGRSEGVAVTLKQQEKDVKQTDKENRRGRSTEWKKLQPPVGNDGDDEVSDLILIIHGIGQGVSSALAIHAN